MARDWVEVVGSARKFSECMIYGRFVDEVLDGAGHFHGVGRILPRPLDRRRALGRRVPRLRRRHGAGQVAIGMQSFIGTDIGRIRRLIGLD